MLKKMIWKDRQGKTISCTEKLKILTQNIEELSSLNLSFTQIQNTQEYKDALEDAILFNIEIQYFEKNLKKILDV